MSLKMRFNSECSERKHKDDKTIRNYTQYFVFFYSIQLFLTVFVTLFLAQLHQMQISQKHYIGDLHEYLAVQYAKSSRSHCRKCKQPIQKDEVRIGIAFDNERFSSKNWFHLQCFQFKPRHHVINFKDIENYITGVEQLTKKDHSRLIKILKKDYQHLQEIQTQGKEKKLIQKKRQQGFQDLMLQHKFGRNELAEVRKQQGQHLVKKRTKKVSKQKHLTHAQNNEFQNLISHYKNYSVQQLKQILQKNNQAKVGRKDQLVAKCADGHQFGRIPPCPKCGGGKLRFDRQNCRYYCPGYMEDTDFVRCDGNFEFDDVKRTQWIE